MKTKPCILSIIPYTPQELEAGVIMYNTQTKEIGIIGKKNDFEPPFIPVKINFVCDGEIVATNEDLGLIYSEDPEEILHDAWHYHTSISGGHSYETFKFLCITDREFANIWLFRTNDQSNQYVDIHTGHLSKIINNDCKCFIELNEEPDNEVTSEGGLLECTIKKFTPKFIDGKIVLRLMA